MKSKKLILLGIFAVLFNFTHLKAQDTIIEYNNYKWKVGGKGIWEKSGNRNLTPSEYNVYNYGIQISRMINNSKFSVQSG
jgi:hypothetical protein